MKKGDLVVEVGETEPVMQVREITVCNSSETPKRLYICQYEIDGINSFAQFLEEEINIYQP